MAAPQPSVRKLIVDELRRTGVSAAQCSRALGRRNGWMWAFLEEHTPKRISAEDRRKLGRFLGSPALMVEWHWEDTTAAD